MRIIACNFWLAAALLLAGAHFGGTASAQSLTPMRGEVRSFSDHFAVRVYPGNPYTRRLRVEVKVYDADFRPIRARVSPAQAMIGAEARRHVLVVVPFAGRTYRRVRICAESVPFPNESTRIRTQICGRFLAHRLQ